MGTCNTTEKPCCTSRFFRLAIRAVAGIAALGWAVMLLWNWLMPEIFTGAQTVSYWQALGILVLSKILFGRFRCGGRGKKRKLREENMTPEEREKLKSRFASRWGNWCCPPKSSDAAAKDAAPAE